MPIFISIFNKLGGYALFASDFIYDLYLVITLTDEFIQILQRIYCSIYAIFGEYYVEKKSQR